MNKSELVDFISEKSEAEVSKTLVSGIVDLVFEGIETGLKKDGEARFVGFGTFKIAHRKASTGRNPRSGESIKIPASNRVKFTAGKELKESVNE
ncbi:MAG: HU family DNA-binding protein [Alphaproteobacteria bacterium]|nr:HU family DNA-binding protein [Alphaproteobacteria bacterium]MCK5554929.1 HU family DNA-binding protein [Alphaproteobacteria bacterium]